MHVGLENEYNSIHPHARCTIDNTILGVYYNSEYNTSSYIGKIHNYNNLKIEYGRGADTSPGQEGFPSTRPTRSEMHLAPAPGSGPRQ